MEDPTQIYELLGLSGVIIPTRSQSRDNVCIFVKYYRAKFAYDAKKSEKPYVGDHYMIFPDFYSKMVDTQDLLKYRESKNTILNAMVSNFRFYYYEKNSKMYHATKHVIRQLYIYCEFIENFDHSMTFQSYFQKETIYVMNIIHAYNLFYYLLDQESILTDDQMNRLIHDYSQSLAKLF